MYLLHHNLRIMQFYLFPKIKTSIILLFLYNILDNYYVYIWTFISTMVFDDWGSGYLIPRDHSYENCLLF